MIPANTAEALFYRAVRPREAVEAARAWLIESYGELYGDEIRRLNYVGVVRTVESEYIGGYEAFLDRHGLARP